MPIAAKDVPTCLNIQGMASDLALETGCVGNINSVLVGTDIRNWYLAERVYQ